MSRIHAGIDTYARDRKESAVACRITGRRSLADFSAYKGYIGSIKLSPRPALAHLVAFMAPAGLVVGVRVALRGGSSPNRLRGRLVIVILPTVDNVLLQDRIPAVPG